MNFLLKNRNSVIPAVLIIFLGGIFCLDYFFLMVGDIDQTFSAWIDDFVHAEPIAVFLFGVLCGHLFWQMDRKKGHKELVKLYHAAQNIPTVYSDEKHWKLYNAVDEVERIYNGSNSNDRVNNTK